MIEINRNPSPRELRWFGWLQLPFFLLICWGLSRRTGWVTIPSIIVLVSFVLAMIGSISPTRLKPIYIGWMMAVFPIGWVVSRLLLAGIFYLVVTPVGLALRCLGYDPMQRRFDRAATTYWVERPDMPDSKRYFRQF